MIATLIKLQKRRSLYGGYFYYAYFKGEDQKNYYTCLYPKKRNYSRWKKVLEIGTTFTNLRLKKGNLIDADSRFKVVENK